MGEYKLIREVVGSPERNDYTARYPLGEHRPVMRGIVVESAGALMERAEGVSIPKHFQKEAIRLDISNEEGLEADEEVVKQLIAGLEKHPRFSHDSSGGEYGYLYQLYQKKDGGMRDEMEKNSWRDDIYAIMDAAE